jgi:sugar lactone lactonase YvrE
MSPYLPRDALRDRIHSGRCDCARNRKHAHSVDVDSQGNVYTAEVSTGCRVQRFVLQGIDE